MEAAGHSRMLAPLPSTQSTVPTHHSLGFPHLKGQTALLREEQQMGQEMGSSALLPGVKPQGGPSPITPMVPTAPVQPWEKSFPKAELLRRKQLVFSSRPLMSLIFLFTLGTSVILKAPWLLASPLPRSPMLQRFMAWDELIPHIPSPFRHHYGIQHLWGPACF